jgi:hypothetical protein
MDMVQKVFQKYETMPTSSVRALFPDSNGRFTNIHSPDMKPPRGTGKHANERCVVCNEIKETKDNMYVQWL